MTETGEAAFSDCTALDTVRIGGGSLVGIMMFKNCRALENVVIAGSVTEIGDEAFADCGNLTELVVEKGNETFCSVDNCVIEIATGRLVAGCSTSVIPDGIDSIGKSAFAGAVALKKVTIPAGTTEIGDNAFRNCTSLESVTIPDSVERIGSKAFAGCGKLFVHFDRKKPLLWPKGWDKSLKECNIVWKK